MHTDLRSPLDSAAVRPHQLWLLTSTMSRPGPGLDVGLVELADLLDALHELRKGLGLSPLVVGRAHRHLARERFLDRAHRFRLHRVLCQHPGDSGRTHDQVRFEETPANRAVPRGSTVAGYDTMEPISDRMRLRGAYEGLLTGDEYLLVDQG
jgi:hypothetical protein